MSKKKKKRTLEPLLFASPDSDGNMQWFTRFHACDPFLAFGCEGKRIGLTHILEYGRMKKEGRFNIVELITDVQDEITGGKKKKKKGKKSKKSKRPGMVAIIAHLQKKYKIAGFKVARNFPAGLLLELKAAKVHVEVVKGKLFPERAVKTRAEIKWLTDANTSAAAGHAAVRSILRASEIGRGGVLKYEGKTVTSESLRHAVNIACLEKGGVNNLTCIVAPGDQAVDCHCVGSGPIKANELIVVDIFPRIAATGYYGDMTRTYLKGKASPEQRKLYNTVKKGHAMAIAAVKAGVSNRAPYKVVTEYFEEQGYETDREKGTGFFHGLGHGVGYDIHEAPNLGSRKGDKLQSGNVITIEPGLYYPGLGGVRVEDVVVVTARGCNLISKSPYSFQIP